ncbi:hypothetical protein CDAR_426531, partial [Caerostris darwini]
MNADSADGNDLKIVFPRVVACKE